MHCDLDPKDLLNRYATGSCVNNDTTCLCFVDPFHNREQDFIYFLRWWRGGATGKAFGLAINRS